MTRPYNGRREAALELAQRLRDAEGETNREEESPESE